jgi:excisionase family DNA binding protein
MQKGHSTRPESPYMTVQEVADFLRVHTMTVYGLLGAGKLAGIRTMGARGHWRISRETVLGLSNGASPET